MPRRNRSDLRNRITELLLHTREHPTAAWVFDRLRNEFPRVAIGTVYRNLNILVDEGIIKNIKFDSPTEHYDANTSKHYHFICESCGAIRRADNLLHISACPSASLPSVPSDVDAIRKVLVEAERCAVRGYTEICNLTAG